jgi:hypothetical protein
MWQTKAGYGNIMNCGLRNRRVFKASSRGDKLAMKAA